MAARKILAYGAIYVLWGGSFLAIREIVAVVPPFFAAGFRFTAAGLALLLWSRFDARFELRPRQIAGAVALGLVMFTCDYASLFWAETRVASGIAAVVFAMIPVWIFAGEVFLLRERRATAISLGGIALGFAGVVLLGLRHAGGGVSAFAILIMVGGTLCWSVGTLWSRRMALPRPQHANSGLQMFSGGFFLLLLAAGTGELHRLPPLHVLLGARVVASMAYLIVAASIVSYSAYVWLIAHDSPTRVASYAYVNPVFALMIGAALAGERLTPMEMGGAALVVVGVFATLMGRSSASVKPAAEQLERPAALR